MTRPAVTSDDASGRPPDADASGPAPNADALAFLTQPVLTRLWTAVRTRLERNGLQTTGTIRLQNLTPQEREALSLLLARPVTRTATTIRLADLDTRLRASAVGRGLVATLEHLGPPLTDRRAERNAAAAERGRLWLTAETALAATPLADRPWARQWLADLRSSGAVTRHPPDTAATTLTQAIHTFSTLFSGTSGTSGTGGTGGTGETGETGEQPTPTPWGRGELATRTTGSAHGLDDGTLLSRLVLRGIALAHGTDVPGDAAGRRALWRMASVTPDEVSSTVLTYGLRPTGRTWREAALRERADHHMETHLTLRELRALHLGIPSRTRVHVCENPRVVEAAADAGCTAPLVCTSGSATTAVLTLLDALATADCALAYHGDFDWPGVALANRIMQRYESTTPWRMTTADYEHLATRTQLHGTPRLPLTGAPVEATWDPELAPAMEALGVALHEESVLDLLLEDLG